MHRCPTRLASDGHGACTRPSTEWGRVVTTVAITTDHFTMDVVCILEMSRSISHLNTVDKILTGLLPLIYCLCPAVINYTILFRKE